jgi:hypothetical protein
MVGTMRDFVALALRRCWAALLRSLRPSVRAVAVFPEAKSELPLGMFCRFRLSSVTTGGPVEGTAELRQMLDANRAAFAGGSSFRSLEHVARSGAVMLAHISERGFINGEHFLAVYLASVRQQNARPTDIESDEEDLKLPRLPTI